MANAIETVTGIFLLVFGLAYLINSRFWATAYKRMLGDIGLLLPVFMMALILGLIVIMGHNLWVADWRVIVTIVGWAAAIKGALVILFPRILGMYTSWSEQTFARMVRLGGVIWFVFGLFVTYMSLRPS